MIRSSTFGKNNNLQPDEQSPTRFFMFETCGRAGGGGEGVSRELRSLMKREDLMCWRITESLERDEESAACQDHRAGGCG